MGTFKHLVVELPMLGLIVAEASTLVGAYVADSSADMKSGF